MQQVVKRSVGAISKLGCFAVALTLVGSTCDRLPNTASYDQLAKVLSTLEKRVNEFKDALAEAWGFAKEEDQEEFRKSLDDPKKLREVVGIFLNLVAESPYFQDKIDHEKLLATYNKGTSLEYYFNADSLRALNMVRRTRNALKDAFDGSQESLYFFVARVGNEPELNVHGGFVECQLPKVGRFINACLATGIPEDDSSSLQDFTSKLNKYFKKLYRDLEKLECTPERLVSALGTVHSKDVSMEVMPSFAPAYYSLLESHSYKLFRARVSDPMNKNDVHNVLYIAALTKLATNMINAGSIDVEKTRELLVARGYYDVALSESEGVTEQEGKTDFRFFVALATEMRILGERHLIPEFQDPGASLITVLDHLEDTDADFRAEEEVLITREITRVLYDSDIEDVSSDISGFQEMLNEISFRTLSNPKPLEVTGEFDAATRSKLNLLTDQYVEDDAERAYDSILWRIKKACEVYQN